MIQRLKNNTCIILILSITLASCQRNAKEWNEVQKISLDSIAPIGLTYSDNGIWLSDGDKNRLVLLNDHFEVQQIVENIARPMHIENDNGKILIPSYGADAILSFDGNTIDTLALPEALDAPAGVARWNDEMAIADFYKHRILYYDGTTWISIGEEGKKIGQLYYPTDVQITDNEIIVADAYNNRIQVFDKAGKATRLVGSTEKMNAATGLFVGSEQWFVCDFENNRLIIYNKAGIVDQIIENINKPTDALLWNDQLFVTSYGDKQLFILKK